MDYDYVADHCRRHFPVMCAKCIEIADNVGENKFLFNMTWDMERTEETTVFDGDIDWYLIRNNDKEYLFQMSRMRYLINAAQAYRLTSDEKYVRTFKRLMSDFIDRVPCAGTSGDHPWRSLEVGLRGEYWTKAMDLVRDSHLIDENFVRKYQASLATHAEMLIKHHDRHKKLSNWGVIQDHGLFAIGIELGNRQYIDVALARLYEQARLQILADGMHWEASALYHNEVLLCFVDAIIRAKKAGIVLDEDFLGRVHRMAEVDAAWIKPNHKQPLFGDSDYADIRDVLSQCACVFADGKLKYHALPVLDYESAWLLGRAGIEEYAAIPALPPSANSISLRDGGCHIMRSGYDEKANYLIFHNGYTGAGHAHEDKLSFDLTVAGTDMIVDCGRYTYKWGKERKFFKSYKAHNTVSIDGRHFIKARGWGFSRLAEHIKGELVTEQDYELVSGSHLGYFRYLFGGAVITRKILWIKPDIYILIDHLRMKGVHRYTQHFNFAPGGALTATEKDAIYQNGKSSIYIKPLKKNVRVRAKRGKYSDHYNFKEACARLECSCIGCGNNSAVTVIVANPEGKYRDIDVRTRAISGSFPFRMSQNQGESVVIKVGGDTYTVIFSHREASCAVNADDKYSAAKIAYYKNSAYHVVEW